MVARNKNSKRKAVRKAVSGCLRIQAGKCCIIQRGVELSIPYIYICGYLIVFISINIVIMLIYVGTYTTLLVIPMSFLLFHLILLFLNYSRYYKRIPSILDLPSSSFFTIAHHAAFTHIIINVITYASQYQYHYGIINITTIGQV